MIVTCYVKRLILSHYKRDLLNLCVTQLARMAADDPWEERKRNRKHGEEAVGSVRPEGGSRVDGDGGDDDE